MKSSLAKYIPKSPATDEEMHEMEKKLYVEKDKVILKVQEISDPFYRQEVRNNANKKFGVKK